jgi:hypothetical protein
VSRDFAPALADALRRAITRNPLLDRETWAQYDALIAEYEASAVSAVSVAE